MKNLYIIIICLAISSCSFRAKNGVVTLPLSLSLPERSELAVAGNDFIVAVDTLDVFAREKLVVKEILSGNVPSFLRHFREVEFVRQGKKINIFVLPDYLALGSDSDFVRMPMTPMAAQIIADSLDCSMPTSLLVNEIAKASDGAIEPFPFRPLGDRNTYPITFQDSNNAINSLLKAYGFNDGDMISGLKKDVILSKKISDPKRTHHVTIYGWHYPDGTYIQPSTNIHLNWYVDYSHGIRLVSNTVMIDDKPYKLSSILCDPEKFSLLSDEDSSMLQARY